jgi:hypothetical protein
VVVVCLFVCCPQAYAYAVCCCPWACTCARVSDDEWVLGKGGGQEGGGKKKGNGKKGTRR